MHEAPNVVVVTGGTAGVGRATVRQFASRGVSVGVIARGRKGMDATLDEIYELGAHGCGVLADVADPVQVASAAERIERALGPIDVWINNAMTTVFGRLRDIRPDEYRRVTDVTYHGVVWGTQAALEHMLPRGRGVIIQVGSALAFRAIPLQTAYCGAKHAIKAMTEGLRSELIHDGIDIHLGMVHLPGMNTPQFTWCRSKMEAPAQPVPPIFQPEVAARAIEYAVDHRRRELYVGFPTVETVIGEQLAPGIMDHVLAHKAFDGQMVDEPGGHGKQALSEAERPDNLFEPVDVDRGAHGTFDERAREEDAFTRAVVPAGSAGARAGFHALTGGLLMLAGALIARRLRRRA